MIEKERKDWEREEARRAKGRDREQQRQLLGLQRKEEQRGDEAVRGADRQLSKKNDKARQLVRKDVNAEVKRSRGEANLLVLQFFDEEEEGVEVAELSCNGYENNRGAVDGQDNNNKSSSFIINDRDVCSSVQQYLQETALRKEELLPVGGTRAANKHSAALRAREMAMPCRWDDVFQVTSTLHVFRRHLHLEDPVVLDSVINSLHAVSLASSSSSSTAASSSSSTAASSSSSTSTAPSASDVVDRTDPSSGVIKEEKDSSSHLEKGESSEEHCLEDKPLLTIGKGGSCLGIYRYDY